MTESHQHIPDSHCAYLIHRRASKACQSCRERKIRCDVTVHGIPCQNCRNSDVSCQVVKCRRGKKHKEWYSKSSQIGRNSPSPRHVPMEALLHGEGKITSIAQEKRLSNECSRPTPSEVPVVHANCDFVSASIARLGDFLGVHLLEQSMVPLTPPETDTSIEDLPSYFRPFPTHLEDSDVEYARTKGAFCVPHGNFRNEIIRSYLAFVHWYLPMVDTEELLQLVDCEIADPTSSGYSLLLFQCIMFAAVGFVDEATVKEAGYESLRMTRKIFYHRARLLYDLEFEQNSLVLVQCLLLMSLWSEKPEGHKEAWYWAGIAISVAQTNRLYQNPDRLQISPREKRLRKRVWWCCFMRDRLLSLGIGRPMRIRDDEFDVPLLTLGDFETELTLQDGQTTTEGVIPWDRIAAEQLAEIFIAKVKLCKTVGSILSTQYSMLDRASRPLKRDAGSFSSILLFPIPSRSSEMATGDGDDSLRHFEAELTNWKNALPHPLQLSKLPLCSVATGKRHDGVQPALRPRSDEHSESPLCMLLQCALLHMSYHAAVSILHRPRSASAPSRAKMSASANAIAKIVSLLNAKGLASFLPTNATPMLMASIASNALLIKSTALKSNPGTNSTEQKRREVEQARDNASELLVALSSLRKVYFSSDAVWALVETMLAHLGLKIVASKPIGDERTNQKPSQRSFELVFIRNPTDVRERGVVAAAATDHQLSQHNTDGVKSETEISPPPDLPDMHFGASLVGDALLFDACTGSGDTGAYHNTEAGQATWDSLLDTLDCDGFIPTQVEFDWDGMNWGGTDWETLAFDWPS